MKEPGAKLMELMVVLAVSAILLGLASPSRSLGLVKLLVECDQRTGSVAATGAQRGDQAQVA